MKAARSSGAALLAVVVSEGDTFTGDSINVRRLVTHHATAVVADIPSANVVTPNDENVRFFLLRSRHMSLAGQQAKAK